MSEKITMVNGKLNVPENPIIPFVEGDGTGSLKNPVVVTHSEYKNYKQYIFIGDETGGLCLISLMLLAMNAFA